MLFSTVAGDHAGAAAGAAVDVDRHAPAVGLSPRRRRSPQWDRRRAGSCGSRRGLRRDRTIVAPVVAVRSPWSSRGACPASRSGRPRALALRERHQRDASPSMRPRLLSSHWVKGRRLKGARRRDLRLCGRATRARRSRRSGRATRSFTFTPRCIARLAPSCRARDAKRPTVWPWPIARATTSSRMPPRGQTGTSTCPLGGLDGEHVARLHAEALRAVSWADLGPGLPGDLRDRVRRLLEQGRCAPEPSPSSGEGTGSSAKARPSPASWGALNSSTRHTLGQQRDCARRTPPRTHRRAGPAAAPVGVRPGLSTKERKLPSGRRVATSVARGARRLSSSVSPSARVSKSGRSVGCTRRAHAGARRASPQLSRPRVIRQDQMGERGVSSGIEAKSKPPARPLRAPRRSRRRRAASKHGVAAVHDQDVHVARAHRVDQAYDVTEARGAPPARLARAAPAGSCRRRPRTTFSRSTAALLAARGDR